MNRLLLEYIDSVLMETSPAATQAKAMGLKYMGFGKWGKGGVVTHKNVDKEGSSLVQYSAPAKKSATKKSVDKKKQSTREIELPKSTSPERDKTLRDEVTPPSGDRSNEFFGTPGHINHRTIPEPISREDIIAALGPGADRIPPVLIDALVFLLNTDKTTKGLVLSDILRNSGAGTPSSQLGEILTTIHLALTNEESENLHNLLLDRLTGKGNVNNNKSMADRSWLKAARNNRIAFERYMNLKYGKGNWSTEAVAWDVRDEVESVIGLDYSQKEPSTDTFMRIRVQTPEGERVVVEEISLKKDKEVNFLNLTTGQFEELIIRRISPKASRILDKIYSYLERCAELPKGKQAACRSKYNKRIEQIYDAAAKMYNIPPELSSRKVKLRQVEIHRQGISNNSEAAIRVAKMISEDETKLAAISKEMSQTPALDYKKLKPVFDLISKHEGTLTLDDIKKYLTQSGHSASLKDVQKICTMLSINASKILEDSVGEKLHQEVYQTARDNSFSHSKNIIEWCMDTKEGRGLVEDAIREQMPIQGVVAGHETMLIGDLHFSRQDAMEMFGTDDFEEIRERFIAAPPPPPPQPRIEYNVDGVDESFIVATITCRPDGITYGSTWKFELGLDLEFERRLRQINEQRDLISVDENVGRIDKKN